MGAPSFALFAKGGIERFVSFPCSAMLRAGLRQRGKKLLLFLNPALIPQLAGSPRERDLVSLRERQGKNPVLQNYRTSLAGLVSAQARAPPPHQAKTGLVGDPGPVPHELS